MSSERTQTLEGCCQKEKKTSEVKSKPGFGFKMHALTSKNKLLAWTAVYRYSASSH
jgi:hypothetical protein